QILAKPDLWMTYHPYYRAPDLLGPSLAKKFAIPYVTVEASYARKRDRDLWAEPQKFVISAIETAALNICFTKRDRDGLAMLGPHVRLAYIKPFIDIENYSSAALPNQDLRIRLIA